MADDKKSDGSVTLLNRSQRYFEIAIGPDKKPIRHAPGAAMVYSGQEAKLALGYKDLVDLSKMPGAVDSRKLKAENNKLSDENSRLKAELAALSSSKTDAPEKEKVAVK